MLFSMFDVKVGTFGQLVTLENAELARRSLITTFLSGQESPVTQFPDDFILYEIGDFDIKTGEIKMHASPIKIITGFEAVEAAKKYLLDRERRNLNDIRHQITDDSESSDGSR